MAIATDKVILPAKGGGIELATPLGIGTNKWTDAEKDLPGLCECAKACLEVGAMMFDTAEVYNSGASERAVGSALKEAVAERRAVIASKHLPLPWHFNARKALREHLTATLERLQVPCIDLFYLHMANTATRPLHAYADGLADAVEAGLVRAVGVSNFSEAQLRSFHAHLATRGVPLAAHQVEFSLMRRAAETSGMLKACKDLGVVLVAWAPLGGGQGRLTTPTLASINAGTDVVGLTPEAAALVREVGAIAEAHEGATVESVAIAWTLSKGVVTLLGTRKATHALDGAQALSLKLTPEEIQRLDAVALDDDGMYKAMLAKNPLTRFAARRLLVPLLQDPLPSKV